MAMAVPAVVAPTTLSVCSHSQYRLSDPLVTLLHSKVNTTLEAIKKDGEGNSLE